MEIHMGDDRFLWYPNVGFVNDKLKPVSPEVAAQLVEFCRRQGVLFCGPAASPHVTDCVRFTTPVGSDTGGEA